MSNFLDRPVVRKHKIKKRYTKNTYRKALRFLLDDFSNRCAYSLVHVSMISESEMHVDHFDPSKKRKCGYENLFPAYGVCNEAKGDSWPRPEESALGSRFLNPCFEKDYGAVIFEHPGTHELVGTTAAARYHILKLDLNNPALVAQRQERTAMANSVLAAKARINAGGEASQLAREICANLEGLLDRKIPPIPPPPAGST